MQRYSTESHRSKGFRSVGEWFAGLHDANLVIGEVEIAAGKRDFGHMAADAPGSRRRAGFCLARAGGARVRCVAGEAFGIVRSVVSDEIFVRIVAGDAADTRVSAVEATTIGEAIGLKADIRQATPTIAHNGFPGAVTLAAEVGERFGSHVPQARRSSAEIGDGRIGRVVERALVTMRTGDARMDGVEGEFVRSHGIAGMAAEAELRIHGGELAAHGFAQGLRSQAFVSSGDAESVRRGVEADDALVELAIQLEDPGLCLGAEAPVDGHGDGAGTISHFVDALTVVGFDGPGISAHVKREQRMGSEHGIGAGQLDGVSHGGFRLHGLAAMTAGAAGVGGLGLGRRDSAGGCESEKDCAAQSQPKK